MALNKVYVLWGEDAFSKHHFINTLKSKYLKGGVSFRVFFAEDLEASQIQDELLTLSSQWRILVVYHAQDLSSQVREVFKRYLKEAQYIIVILDFEGQDYEEFSKSDFGRYLLKISEVKRMRVRRRYSAQDLIQAVERKKTLQVLNIIEALYRQGSLSSRFYSQVLGGLVKTFSFKYRTIPPVLFDMEIKLKRSDFSKSIFEYFMVKLCQRQ